MISVSTTEFNNNTPAVLPTMKYGRDWPVVYIIDNKKDEAYVGETLDATIRATQHLQNPERRRLTEISLISNEEFNKSVILHLESYLIRHMSADGTFHLQNANNGIHHNYFRKEYYEKQFRELWEELLKHNLAKKSLEDVENSNLFKYSPYTSLSPDQCDTAASIIRAIADLGNLMPLTCVVQGGPGTGKTVLAVYLMKLLCDRNIKETEVENEEEESLISIAADLKRIAPDLKVGLVVPMQSLRKTLQGVFTQTQGLNPELIVSPVELTKSSEHYDLLIVDEAHRLRRYKDLNDNGGFKEANIRMGLNATEGNEWDWIKMRSTKQIIFYDEYQSIKPADLPRETFSVIMKESETRSFRLHTQFRCLGGDEYINYVRQVLSNDPPVPKKHFEGYDVRLFNNCDHMVDAIKQLNDKYELCRNVAGFAWEWKAKKKGFKDNLDVVVGSRKYHWNRTDKDWVNSKGSVDEIGCIHTIQGYDLNYCGIIIGWEIDYDPIKKCFTVDKKKYKDRHAKGVGKDIDQLVKYVLNVYKTLMTRGIMGTYIYACNQNLQEYLKQYFETV